MRDGIWGSLKGGRKGWLRTGKEITLESIGAERVGLWVWRYYLMTQDTGFLKTNFPLTLEAASFLYTYATTGSDGKLYMSPSNAHETQWGVTQESWAGRGGWGVDGTVVVVTAS